MRKTVSILMCLIMALGFVLGSFSVAYADNDEIYSNTNGKYSFNEILLLFLDNVPGYGVTLDASSCFFKKASGLSYSYLAVVDESESEIEDVAEWIVSGVGFNEIKEYQPVVDINGYELRWYSNMSSFTLAKEGLSAAAYRHYYDGATGNRLDTGGGSTGVGRPHDYYTQPGGDNTLPNSGNNYYEGDTVNTTIIDNSLGDFNNIGNGVVITEENGLTIYSPDNSTYYTFEDNTDNYYTTNNYITYNTVNYYMPGSDQPLNTWNYFYELPDGRNSATLTEEDIAGLNLDFDVVNYKQATEDLTQKALFHFDGNIENSAPPSNRGLVAGENIFIPSTWLSYQNAYSDGEWYQENGNSSFFSYSSSSGTVTLASNDYVNPVIGLFYFPSKLPVGDYLIEMEVDGLPTLLESNYESFYVALIDRNSYDGVLAGRTRFTNVSNGNISVLASVTNSFSSWSTWGLYLELYTPYARSLSISNISVRPVSWQTVDGEQFESADFEFSSGAGYTFVDTQTPFNAALYLDGLAHQAWFTLPDDSLSTGSDFTFSYRYYNELSTNTSASYFCIGRNQSVFNNFIYVKFDGYRITEFGTYDSSSVSQSMSVTIPAGQWNTITLTRSGISLMLFLNGIQIGFVQDTSGITLAADYIELNLAADNNVKYIDEVLFASQTLYSENHVPRLIPWDTTNILVLPDVMHDSIAVQATLPITGHRIGGVRPTFPEEGMVWMMVEGDFITMIQIYNGYMWVQVNGAVYYQGHWYQLENFNIHIALDDIDIPPGTDIVDPNKPGGSGSGSGSGGSGGGWLDSLFQELLSGVVDIIVEAIKALIGLIEHILSAVADFIAACFSVITIPLEWMQPMGDFIGGIFAIFPAEVQSLYVTGFALIVLVSVIVWLNGKH